MKTTERRALLDIVAMCKARRIPFLPEGGHHHCVKGWVQMHCPLCSPREGWHLGFGLATGAFSCWRCGKVRYWDALAGLLGTNDRAQIRAIAALYRTGATVARPAARGGQTVHLPKWCGPLQTPHRRYLRDRGFDPGLLEHEWGVVGTDWIAGGTWAWRIVIPIYDADGMLATYTGRSIGNAIPRYRTQEDSEARIPAKSLLYGAHKIAPGPDSSVIVVEGPTDAWRIGPGAVATLGTAWTKEQAVLLRQYRRRFICFDPGDDAQRQALDLATWLSGFAGVTEVIDDLPSDPGDADEKTVDELRSLLAENAAAV